MFFGGECCVIGPDLRALAGRIGDERRVFRCAHCPAAHAKGPMPHHAKLRFFLRTFPVAPPNRCKSSPDSAPCPAAGCTEEGPRLVWKCTGIRPLLVWKCTEKQAKLVWKCSEKQAKLVWKCSGKRAWLVWKCTKKRPINGRRGRHLRCTTRHLPPTDREGNSRVIIPPYAPTGRSEAPAAHFPRQMLGQSAQNP